MGGKKFVLLGVIIIIMIIIIILGFYLINFLINKQDLCKKINDETLKQKCLSCENAENPVDCKDSVYINFAFLKKDISLCDDLVQEYRKNECLVNLENAVIRGSKVPSDEILESGGYRKVS